MTMLSLHLRTLLAASSNGSLETSHRSLERPVPIGSLDTSELLLELPVKCFTGGSSALGLAPPVAYHWLPVNDNCFFQFTVIGIYS